MAYDPMSEEVKAKEFVTKILSVSMTKNISDVFQDGPNMHLEAKTRLLDNVMRQTLFELKAYVAGNQLYEGSIKKIWPKTWWDHVKLELLPEWISKRLKPVRYETFEYKTIGIQLMCPHLPVDPRKISDECLRFVTMDFNAARKRF